MTRHALARLSGALCFVLASPHLHAATVSGRVLDPAGAPVAGAKVVWEAYRSDEETLADETRGATPAPLGETATDAEGRFRVTIDKAGAELSIRVLPTSLPSAFLAGPFDSSEDVALDDVELPAAERVAGRVVDEAGKPVSGARVRATAGDFRFEVDDGIVVYAESKTGPDGSFALINAPANTRALTAQAPGFALATQSRYQQRSAEKLTLRSGATVRGTVLDPAGKPAEGAVVSAGPLGTKTDASGAFRLEGVLAGAHTVAAVWKEDFAARRETLRVKKGETAEVSLRLARAATVAGTVVDEKTRRPIANVRVSAFTGGFAFGGNETARRARTDAKGKFRLAGLTPRSYSVRASKADYLPATMPGVAATFSTPGAVSIALQKAGAVAGRVTDEKGAGIPGARVRFARDAGMRSLMRGGPSAFLQAGGVTTGPDGSFKLRDLAAAKNKTLEAMKPGFVPARRHGVTIKSGETIKDVALVLKRGLEARGRVVDTAGQAIAGAEIRVVRPEGGGAARLMFQAAGGNREKPDASSGADGSFRVAGLEPGEYALAVSRDGYATKRIPSVMVEAEGPNEWPAVVLASGVAIAGSVRSSKGEPVVGAQVFSYGEGGGARDGTTDSEGKFRIEGFGSDRPVMLSVTAEGYASLQRRVNPPAEDLSLVLKTSGAIRGRVEDAATNRPVTEFTASYSEGRDNAFGGIRIVMGAGSNEKVFQAADGSFELSDVPPGKWTVNASAPGFRPAEASGIEIGEGETKEGVVLSLKKGGMVSGRVLDPRRGTGVPNASVSWSEGAAAGSMGPALARLAGDSNAVTTDADGRFRIEGLPSGKLTLNAGHPDYLETSRSVDVDDQGSVDLTLSLGGSIAGTVVGKDGRTPVPGAQVALDGQGESFGMGDDSSRTDGSGNFLFEHLKSGRYRLTARAAAGTSPAKDVVLADDQALTGVLIEMATGAVVRGTVTGLPSGRLAGVRVFGSSRDYQESAVTGDDGKFVLRDVPPGVLRLQATVTWPASRSTSKNVEVPEGAGEVPVEILFEGESRLSGRVTRGDKPVPGVFVSAAPDPPSGGRRSSDQTDEDGRYAIEGLTDGAYQLLLYGQGLNYRKTFQVSGDTSGDVALPTLTITGVVTESGSGEPIEGATVQAAGAQERGSPARSAVSDTRGFYSIEDVDSGDYRVTARKDGYQLKTESVSVGASPVEVNLALARGSGLSIRAADGLTGLPLHSLNVWAYADSGVLAYSGAVSLDSEGKGEIASLAPGRYSIYVTSGGYAVRSFPLVSVPSPLLAIAMTPGGRVEVRSDAPFAGRLLDAAGAEYLLFPGRPGWGVNGSPPVTSWDRVAPGSYRLIVVGASGERAYPFTVTEGRTTTVEVR